MGPDIRDRLKDAALEPTFDIDVDDLHQRARRTHVRNVAATAVISVVTLVAGAVLVISTVTSDPQPPVVGPGEETEQTDADEDRQADLERRMEDERRRADELRREAERRAVVERERHEQDGGPSQNRADAARDGVLLEVAALPFNVRVSARPQVAAGSKSRIAADEGVWIVSKPDLDGYHGERVVGDVNGIYGRDFVHLATYAEILLLDEGETEILRAFPLAPYPAANALAVDDDAVYCHRAGDGGDPDSMLCRIERSTFDWIVRIFPASVDSHLANPDVYVPEHWVIDDSAGKVLTGELVTREGQLLLVENDVIKPIDPTTLEFDRNQ